MGSDAHKDGIDTIESLLTDIRRDLAKKPSTDTICGILACIAFMLFVTSAMLVAILIYL